MSGFIRRIIGKAERVSTVLTDVFRESAPFGQEMNVVPRDHADGRVAYLAPHLDFLKEGVAAEARIFLEAVTRRDVPGAMTEQTAEVAHLLLEGR
jgi:hypothetical protein